MLIRSKFELKPILKLEKDHFSHKMCNLNDADSK